MKTTGWLAAGATVAALAWWLTAVWYSASPYNSVTQQSLHFFSRPHDPSVVESLRPIKAEAAWIGSDLQNRTNLWLYTFNEQERNEMREAMGLLVGRNKSIENLTVDDFPLPHLKHKIEQWRRQVSDHGRGVQILRGAPIEAWTQAEIEAFFWVLGRYLGIPGAQDNDGALLSHVRDTGADPKRERQYKASSFINFHCDAADVVGLLCVQAAKAGGSSRLISSVTVYNELLKMPNGPEHLRRLYEPVLMDARGSGGVNFFAVPPLRQAEGVLRTFYHQEYFATAHRHPRAPPMSADTRAALEAYDAVVARRELWLETEFLPGDVQLLSNHLMLHSRTAYEDHADPAKRRHLLRLWLSLDPPGSWHLRYLKEVDRLRMLCSLAYAKFFS